MMTLAPRIVVQQVVLAAEGKLSSGTITPSGDVLPNGIQAADVVNSSAWYVTDRASGVQFPVQAAEVRHLPGSFVRDALFAAGTYKIIFYLA